MSNSDIYYRIYKSRNEPQKLVVVELQWWDELDYDNKRFLNEEKYPSEEAAQAVIDQLIGFLHRTDALVLMDKMSPKGLWAYYLEETGLGEKCYACGK